MAEFGVGVVNLQACIFLFDARVAHLSQKLINNKLITYYSLCLKIPSLPGANAITDPSSNRTREVLSPPTLSTIKINSRYFQSQVGLHQVQARDYGLQKLAGHLSELTRNRSQNCSQAQSL